MCQVTLAQYKQWCLAWKSGPFGLFRRIFRIEAKIGVFDPKKLSLVFSDGSLIVISLAATT